MFRNHGKLTKIRHGVILDVSAVIVEKKEIKGISVNEAMGIPDSKIEQAMTMTDLAKHLPFDEFLKRNDALVDPANTGGKVVAVDLPLEVRYLRNA